VHTDMIKTEIPCMSLFTWIFSHIDFNISSCQGSNPEENSASNSYAFQ
jgi:hypothetical protein